MTSIGRFIRLFIAFCLFSTSVMADGDVVVIEKPLEEVDSAPLLPVPAELYERFVDIQYITTAVRQGFSGLAPLGFDPPREVLALLDYRLGLVERYLKIHALFENQVALDRPGPRDPLKPGPRALDREDLYVIANAYVALLQEPAPSSTGTFWTGVKWRDVNGSPLYFATAHEGEAVRSVLTYQDIGDQRARIRRRLMLMVDVTLGATYMLPGGSIAELGFVSASGQTIHGARVGFLQRVLSLGGIALELLPISIPLVKASLSSSGRALSRGVQDDLVRYLKDKSALQARIKGVKERATHPAYEQIQTDWIQHLDALHGRKSTSISLSRSGVTEAGHPTPTRGIDMYAYAEQANSAAPGIVRELKLKRGFQGRWTRSATGLDRVKTNQMTSEIQDAVRQAGGAAEVDQFSWPWILDRALKKHAKALEDAKSAVGPAAQAAAREEAAAAQDLLRRFSDGNLERQLCVMTGEGEVHVKTGTLVGPRSSDLRPLVNDVVAVPTLQAIAKKYLDGLVPPPPGGLRIDPN